MDSIPRDLLPLSDLATLTPVWILVSTALVVLFVDLFLPVSRKNGMLPFISVLGVIGALLALYFAGPSPNETTYAFYNCLRFDYMTFLAHTIILGVALFLLLISPLYLRDRMIPRAEYYVFMLFATMAMMVFASSNELLTLFLNLELLSFTLYVLTGMEKQNLRSTEAAFKYFLTGSYAAAFILFGLTMVYGAVGTTFFGEIASILTAGPEAGLSGQTIFLMSGFALMMVGFGFKLTLAPFHMYAPDVYAGAPTPVAAAIATGSKVAAIVVFFQIFRFFAGWSERPESFFYILYGVTILSIVVGNIGAVIQPNIKRLLAYSGVAHSGYFMIPLVATLARPEQDLMPSAERAVSYYLVAYALMTVLAFGVAATLGPRGDNRIERYAGLARRSPVLAAVLALSMLSLTGVPPTVGFIGKVYLFSVAVEAKLYFLAFFGVLASVASAYYYLRVIVKMYMEEAPEEEPIEPAPRESANAVVLLVYSAGVLLFAIFPPIDYLR